MLEPYPQDSTLREHVHARNKAVVATMKRAYGAYIDDFTGKVRAIHADPAVAQAQGKPHPELQLFELLPPWPTAVLPTPPGIETGELKELFGQETGSSELMAWKAITEKHNEIWGVRTVGSMWLASEFSVESGFGQEVGGGGKLALKLNFEVSTDSKSDAIEVKPSAKKTIFFKNVELDPDTGVVKGKLKSEKLLGPFEVEADSTGKLTLKYGAAKDSYDRANKQVGLGLGGSISLRDLVRNGKPRGKDWPAHGEPEWLKKLPELKTEVSLNYQLSRPSDILAVVSNAPGLVPLGARKVFMEADWGSLRDKQREALKVLGWDQASWDRRDPPKSAKTPYNQLSPEEKDAAGHLPVPKEGQWVDFWEEFKA